MASGLSLFSRTIGANEGSDVLEQAWTWRVCGGWLVTDVKWWFSVSIVLGRR